MSSTIGRTHLQVQPSPSLRKILLQILPSEARPRLSPAVFHRPPRAAARVSGKRRVAWMMLSLLVQLPEHQCNLPGSSLDYNGTPCSRPIHPSHPEVPKHTSGLYMPGVATLFLSLMTTVSSGRGVGCIPSPLQYPSAVERRLLV